MQINRRDFLKKILVVAGGIVATTVGVEVLPEILSGLAHKREVYKVTPKVFPYTDPAHLNLALKLIEEHELISARIILHPNPSILPRPIRSSDLPHWGTNIFINSKS